MQERSPEERFAEIYDRHLAAVSAYVRRRTAADDAADIVSDTFLVCWQKLERVPAEPLPWLYAVARNTLANHRRSAARRQTPLPADDEIAGDPAASRMTRSSVSPSRESASPTGRFSGSSRGKG